MLRNVMLCYVLFCFIIRIVVKFCVVFISYNDERRGVLHCSDTHSLPLPPSQTLPHTELTHIHIHVHTPFPSLFLTHTHTHTHILPLSLLTYTHTQVNKHRRLGHDSSLPFPHSVHELGHYMLRTHEHSRYLEGEEDGEKPCK
jgi:hypothetical protein